jgi:hypothetical protein
VPACNEEHGLLAPGGPRTRADRAHLAIVAAFVIGSAVFIVDSLHRVGGQLRASLFDDAMISMRYAHHLASGHGLVWNVGDAPIEGFSNPLWTAWMTVLHLLPVPLAVVPVLVMLTSAAALVANLFVVRGIARVLAPGQPRVALLAVVLVASYYPLSFWALRGMEVGFLALLIDLAVLLAIRRSTPRSTAALAVVLAAMVLTRTDATLPALVIAGWCTLRAPRAQRARRGVVLVGTVIGAAGGLLAAQAAYFGDALPNTYYLKLTGIPLSTRLDVGGVDLARLVVVHLGVGLLLATSALRRPTPRTWLLVAIVSGQLAYSVFVGGDAWEGLSFANRYIAVAMPCLLVLAAVGAQRLVVDAGRHDARALGATAAAGALLAALAAVWGDQPADLLAPGLTDPSPWIGLLLLVALVLIAVTIARARVAGFVERRPTMTMVGLALFFIVTVNGPAVTTWLDGGASFVAADNAMLDRGHLLRDATAPDATIAAYWAGNSPWVDDRTTYDVLGKSDARIAHEAPYTSTFRPGHDKRDLGYTVGVLRPDVVDLGVYFGMPADEAAAYEAWGYELLPGGLEVRRDSTKVNRALLASG